MWNLFQQIQWIIVQLNRNKHDFQKEDSQRFYKQGFLISQNSSENTCARVSFHLSYRLESCNPIKKGLQHMRCGFAKFLSTSFLQNTSRRLLLNFFINFTFLFFATQWTNCKQFFYIFKHILSRLLNVNLNNLVVAAWEHTFLGDSTWNLTAFYTLIKYLYVIYYILTESLSPTVMQLFNWTSD